MNSRLKDKIVVQGFRYKFCRFSLVQSNNKTTNSRRIINFHYKSDSTRLNYVLKKVTSDRFLFPAPRPFCMNFHRNISYDINKSKPVIPNALDNECPPLIIDTPTILGPERVSAVEQIDIWAENIFVQYVENLIVDFHQIAGLPWWASFVVTALLLRTSVVLPFAIFQMRLKAKQEKVDLLMRKVLRKLKEDSKIARLNYGWPNDIIDHEFQKVYRKEQNDLINKYGSSALKNYLLVMVQVTVWTVSTCASLHLCIPPPNQNEFYNELTAGGFSWITDLTICDPYWILPIAIGLVNLATVQVHDSFNVNKISLTERNKYTFARCSSLVIASAALLVPASTNIYWLSSSLYGLMQALILNTRSAKQILKVPIVDPRYSYPILLGQVKSRLQIGSK